MNIINPKDMLFKVLSLHYEDMSDINVLDGTLKIRPKASHKVDAYIQSLDRDLKADKKMPDRMKVDRFKYGLPQKNRPEYLYIQEAISALNQSGVAVILAPLSVLYRSGTDKEIRKGIIKDNLIETLIFLPSIYPAHGNNDFVIMILRKGRLTSDTLLIQLKNDNTDNHAIDYEGLGEILHARANIAGESYLASLDDIVKNDYSLSAKHYFNESAISQFGGMLNLEEQIEKEYKERKALIAEFLEREETIEATFKSITEGLRKDLS